MDVKIYKPSSEPKAMDLSKVGIVYEDLDEEDQERWAKSSKQSDLLIKMTDDLGTFHAVEIDGDLHVQGDFNPSEHRIAALWIKGNLIVDGVYLDQDYPQIFVLIEGNLEAKNIVTGGQLEVHGKVITQHLVGNYNDYSAMFLGEVKATTFFAETHYFEFLSKQDIALTLDVWPSPDSMELYVSAFVLEEFVDVYGEVNKRALLEAVAQGHEILCADPRDLSTVTQIDLVEKGLETLPDSLFSFPNLVSLNLSDNKLKTLDGIGKLKNLGHLILEGNPLEALPKSLSELPLQTLDLGYWTNLSDWFSQLQHLETLILTVDELEIFPLVITNLPALKSLVLKGWLTNQTQILLPDLLSNMPDLKLKHLSITDGRIEYLGEDLSPFEQLETLDLKGQLLGEIERDRIIRALPKVDVRF